jgi:hypothetical protein
MSLNEVNIPSQSLPSSSVPLREDKSQHTTLERGNLPLYVSQYAVNSDQKPKLYHGSTLQEVKVFLEGMGVIVPEVLSSVRNESKNDESATTTEKSLKRKMEEDIDDIDEVDGGTSFPQS